MGQFIDDFAAGQAGIAYRGAASDVWHRLGASRKNETTTKEEWLRDSGLDFEAVKVPARYEFNGALRAADDLCFNVHSRTGRVLGRQVVTDVYQPVQPVECYEFFQQFVGVDDRFALDVLGNFKGGAIVWGSAVFRDRLEIAGEPHVMRLMLSTTFDASAATRAQAHVTRPVCDNTIAMAHTEHDGAVVSVRHNTRFNRDVVARQLAGLVASTVRYKAMGDAMATVMLAKTQVSGIFKTLLEIPFDAKQDDISTRKFNQFRALNTAFGVTRRERNAGAEAPIDAWTVLQAVTRYVDHDRVSINGDNGEKQFLSANFGSGDSLKGKAMGLIMPMIKDKVAA